MDHDPNIFRDSSQVIQEVEDQLERILQKKFRDVDSELVERINREKVAILLVEQNVVKALTLAHRGFVLENGRMVMAGTGSELLGNEHLKKAYLGM
jgi:ABC-type branched-subunit amino acid transport system ATPase component